MLFVFETLAMRSSIASPAACDTRNTSVTEIIVGGAGSAAVNGKYMRAPRLGKSDGLPIFSLDEEHQLYSRDNIWRLGFRGNYIYYISNEPHLKGPPRPSPGEWNASDKGEGSGPSSIECKPSTPSPTPAPTPPAPTPPGTYLEFVPGSKWESFGYPHVCTRFKKLQVGPDSMPIAWFDRNTSTAWFLTSNHRHMNAGIGPSLDNLTRCNPGPVFHSTYNSTPQSYANYQWLQSVSRNIVDM